MKFKLGDLVEIIDGAEFNILREYIGREGVVDGPYPTPHHLGHPEWQSYVVWVDGERIGFYEHCLRLKRPPSWDEWLNDSNLLSRGDKQDVRELAERVFTDYLKRMGVSREG